MKKREMAYDRCLRCPYLGDGCDGPNTLSMSLERWCEWCRSLKNIRGYTNEYVAEQSGVSLNTISRIMSGTVSKDIMRSTASDINRVLVGSERQWPCSLAVEEDTPEVYRELEMKSEELSSLRDSLAHIHESYERELRTIREEAQRKVDYLKMENDRKDAIIKKLLEVK